MKTDYARRKLKSLLIDLDSYTNEEFKRQMFRIIAGATGQDVQDDYFFIKNERDALAAQVKACSGALKSLLKTPVGIGDSLQADGQFYYKVAESVFKKAESALAKTPQQCLAEIRAETIESAVTYLAESIPDKSHESVIFKDRYVYISNRYLREYAAKVRQGGE